MNKETLDHLELCIFAEQTHDINFQNIAKELFKEVCFQKEEIERLNNIINELEKWLKEDKEFAMNNFECGRCFNMFDIINKLKELKKGK